MRYLFLFPGLPIFCFNLLVLGGVDFPAEFEILGRQINDFESLTFSGKTLANLIEIYIAALIGIIASIMLYFKKPKKLSINSWKFIGIFYLVVIFIYILMPALPE